MPWGSSSEEGIVCREVSNLVTWGISAPLSKGGDSVGDLDLGGERGA